MSKIYVPVQRKAVPKVTVKSDVRNQDTIYVVIGVSQTAPGRTAAWNYFKTNIKEFLERFEGSPLIGRLIKGITDNFASEEMASDVETFFRETKPIESTQRAIQQSIECIKLNAAWLARDSGSIEKFLVAEM